MSPSPDLLFLLAYAAVLGIDFCAGAAFLVIGVGRHDQSHAASFAGSVFLGAVLAEVSPLVTLASHLVLVVETHLDASGVYSLDSCEGHLD